ncbi:MAG TPA: PQQ-binding-like beta-propeller repeat protein, partial [Gemmataceae bacterium]|nr:PQQ-binding-like beta-propeller repeat protein [Gemmataceae bacterium]
GLGNGRIGGPDADSKLFEPIGALLCVDAETGKALWPPYKVGNGVLNRPAIDRTRVYFGSRDGACYCLDRQTGKLRWKKDVGSAVVATPALEQCSTCGHTSNVYALGVTGQVYCLDSYTGKVHWSFTDLEKNTATLAATPAIVVTHTPEGDRRRIYLGASLNNNTIQALYCLEDLSPER